MFLPDNHVLINALRVDAPHHHAAKSWLEDALNQRLPLRLFPTVEAGFVRVVTYPRIFSPSTPFAEAWHFLEVLVGAPTVEICAWTSDTRRVWGGLCLEHGYVGNDVNDAMLAALAIERGFRLVTFDRGFARFPGLTVTVLPV